MGEMQQIDTESLATELVQLAKAIVGGFPLSAAGFSAGEVAAALRTKQGSIYTGICLDLGCGIGFCAEHAAIAEMLKARETEIAMIVAVGSDVILSPCGRCREMMAQVNRQNLNTQIIMPGGRLRPLHELLPEHWLEPTYTDNEKMRR
jgi:cytidine deaminase